MNITQEDIKEYYGEELDQYQKEHFEQIADAIRYVDGTTKENDMIYAVDFYWRIRRYKELINTGGGGGGGEWTGDCCFGDNIPAGCGEDHGQKMLSYKLVNCVTARMKDPSEALGNGCLCEDNFVYGPPTCRGLHGVWEASYTLVGVTLPITVLGRYYVE